MAGTMDKIKAKVDNVLHKDKSHDDPTGPHSSHAANKADPRVDSDRVGPAGNVAGAQHNTGTMGTHTGTHTGTGTGLTGTTHGTHNDPTGPHSSHMANKVDPRVDSDRIGTAGNTETAGGHGMGQYGSNTTHTGTTGGLTGDTHGTHGTTGGLTGSHGTTGGLTSNTHGTHGTTGGLTGSHGTHGTTGYSDPTGPHDSHLANKADPWVDSDRVGTAGNTAGTTGGHGLGQYGSSTTGTHGTHGTTGAGLTGTHGAHGTHGTVGSGNSNTTAGPHNSDMMNKLDPRVDSDLDGSKTVGGNATYK